MSEINYFALFCTIVGVLVSYVVFSLFQKRHIFRFAKNYKGYRFYPVIGNGIHVFGKNIFDLIRNSIEQFGLPCNLWLGHDYYYITADAAEIKIVLNNPETFGKMKVYKFIEIGFGRDGLLLTSKADLWKRHRKYFAKSFSQPTLNGFVTFFSEKSEILLGLLENTDKRDIFELFDRFTYDSFWRSMIGFDYDLQLCSENGLVEGLKEIQEIGGKRLLQYFYYPHVLWIFTKEGIKIMRILMKIKTFIYDAIKKRRKHFNDNPVSLDRSDGLLLLDLMLLAEADNKFTDKQIFEELLLFASAAIDTSGHTLAYLFTLLGMNPEIQDKMYEEIITVIGKEKPVSFEDLPRLKYTERAILETLRLLPVVPIYGRLATSNIDLGTKVLPKDTNFLVSVLDVHRNAKYWPNPLEFDPDRFLAEKAAEREPYAFIPFSGGSRNCIGKTYSLMLIKTCAANVLRNYRASSPYKSVSDLKLTSCVTMRTSHKLECRFIRRAHTQR